MKRVVTFIILTLFLTSFVFASTKITFKAVESDEANPNKITFRAVENQENAQDNQTQNQSEITRTQTQSRGLTQEQRQEIRQERNRLRAQDGECAEGCTCTGSVTRCILEDGTREMTITAGNSGNTIIQVKGINASTNVTLYKSEGKIYGDFDNKTREVRVMPDQVQDKIQERINRRLQNQTIELDENGIYRVEGRKRARLFLLIPVRERVRAQVDSETGEIIRIRNPWWGFLARDVEEEEADEE